MGAFYSKQPNGNYCRFSTVLGTVTKINILPLMMEPCAYILPFYKVKELFVPDFHSLKEFKELLKEMGDTKGFTHSEIMTKVAMVRNYNRKK